jgi:hypothetical protein
MPSAWEVDAMLFGQMGWELPGGATVAVGTSRSSRLQLRAVAERRMGLHMAFVREAMGLGKQADTAALGCLPFGACLPLPGRCAGKVSLGSKARSLCGAWRLMASRTIRHTIAYKRRRFCLVLLVRGSRWVGKDAPLSGMPCRVQYAAVHCNPPACGGSVAMGAHLLVGAAPGPSCGAVACRGYGGCAWHGHRAALHGAAVKAH